MAGERSRSRSRGRAGEDGAAGAQARRRRKKWAEEEEERPQVEAPEWVKELYEHKPMGRVGGPQLPAHLQAAAAAQRQGMLQQINAAVQMGPNHVCNCFGEIFGNIGLSQRRRVFVRYRIYFLRNETALSRSVIDSSDTT